MNDGWTHHGKVRARESEAGLEVVVDGLTPQAKYYKPLIYEFFRKAWRGSRPAWGEYAVEIGMEYVGAPPWLDLDNLAKALLDAITGSVFHDDAQVVDSSVAGCTFGGGHFVVLVLQDGQVDVAVTEVKSLRQR